MTNSSWFVVTRSCNTFYVAAALYKKYEEHSLPLPQFFKRSLCMWICSYFTLSVLGHIIKKAGDHSYPTCWNGPIPIFLFLNLKMQKTFKLHFLHLDFKFCTFRTLSSTQNYLVMHRLPLIHSFCFLTIDITCCSGSFCTWEGWDAIDMISGHFIITVHSFFMPFTCNRILKSCPLRERRSLFFVRPYLCFVSK